MMSLVVLLTTPYLLQSFSARALIANCVEQDMIQYSQASDYPAQRHQFLVEESGSTVIRIREISLRTDSMTTFQRAPSQTARTILAETTYSDIIIVILV